MSIPSIVLDIIIVCVSIFMLWFGADWFVESSSYIARKIGVSELIIGLTIVAIGTSAPEFAVSIGSAIKGYKSISVANIIGSNIFNTAFILGGVSIFHPIKIDKKLIFRDSLFLLFMTIALIIIAFIFGKLTRIAGIIFVISLGLYVLYLFIRKDISIVEEIEYKELSWRAYPMFGIGLTGILVGAHYLVEGGKGIAHFFHLSDWVIGATIIAAGTSAPEFITSLVAVIKRRYDISAGNIIGSNIFNLVGVLGTAASIKPLDIPPSSNITFLSLLLLTIITIIFMRTSYKLSRIEGLIMFFSGLIIWLFALR